jgi:Ran GTPase-activating protein (RanGAP) involved in mRNA processing and transport
VSSNRRGSFKAFAALPALERIVELEISGSDRHDDWTVGDEGAQQLAASPHLRSLERLVIGPNGIGEGGAAALAQAPWLPQLKKLSIGKNTVDPRMFEALTGLRELSVMGTKVVADGLARCALTLERLRLRDCGLGPAGAQALAGFAMPALAALLLDENMIRDDGAVALARARWPKLESLRLDHNGIGDAGAAALAEMKSPLIELNLSNNYIKAAGARALAESTVLTTLLRLNLESNQLGVEGVTALADGKGLPALNELGCAYNGIYTAEVEQWTDWDGSAVGEGKVAESYAALKARFAGKPHLKIP